MLICRISSKLILIPAGNFHDLTGGTVGESEYRITMLIQPLSDDGSADINVGIARVRDDNDPNVRHTAMAVNADMSTLIQLMDIGTPTNISQNK